MTTPGRGGDSKRPEPKVALQPLPPGAKHRFHAMVKPVGSLCNLDCKYCYYLHKEALLQQPRQPRMADEMLERHIRQYIEAQTGDEVVFSWQGGEPTILGLGFFRKVIELQARYRKPGQRIENDLQTKGTLLDEERRARSGAVAGVAFATVPHRRVLRQGARARAQRRRLPVRPLRVTRIPARQPRRYASRDDGPFRGATELRDRQAGHAAE